MKLINKIQQHLLLNYPLVWSSRVIPATLFGLSIALILFLVFYISPVRDFNSPVFISWIFFLTLCSIISVIVYLVFLFRFNAFKFFGKLNGLQFFFQFILVFLSISIFVSWPFIPRLAGFASVYGKYSLQELSDDFDEAYVLAYQLEYTKGTAPYRISEIVIDAGLEQESEEDYSNNSIRLRSFEFIDRGRFEKLERKSDSLYLGYEKLNLVCVEFDYNITLPYDLSDKIYKSFESKIVDKEAKLTRLSELFAKYIPNYNGSVLASESSFSSDYGYEEESKVCTKYRLNEFGYQMGKYSSGLMKKGDLFLLFKMWMYISLYISIFIIIFRYMSPRTFLWTLLFGFLLFIFSVIVSIIFSFEKEGILGLMIAYYLIFSLLAFSLIFTKSRNVFQGIALNLSFFFVHLFPVICGLMVTSFLSAYDVDYQSRFDAILSTAEGIGLFLLLISLLFVHSRLFYKWYSLPEE